MIGVDVHEPSNIINLIQQSIPVTIDSYNNQGQADYSWDDCNIVLNQWERKQAGEFLGGIEHLVGQLVKQSQHNGRMGIVIEGFFIPHTSGTQVLVKRSDRSGSPYWSSGRKFSISYSAAQEAIDAIQREGIAVQHTVDYAATASTIVSLYKSSQKSKHTLFTKYITPKVRHHNPHVATLLGICSANPDLRIGDVKATALIERFKTVGELLRADPHEIATVEGVGVATAKKLLEVIG